MSNLSAISVGLDSRRLPPVGLTGVGSYRSALRQAAISLGIAVECLTDAAVAIPSKPPGRFGKLIAAVSPSGRHAPLALGERLAPDCFRRAQVHFDLYHRPMRVIDRHPPTLMHWSHPLPLRFAGAINIYSVLDLIPVLQPGLSPMNGRRLLRLLRSLDGASTHFTTISETSRREIMATLGWPGEQVTNISLAVDVPSWSGAQRNDAVAAACHQAGLRPGGYFLYVGTVERRKNIARLIEAYRASGSRRPLVLAGSDGWHAEEQLAQAGALLHQQGEGPRIVRLGYVERTMLLGLIAGAVCVLAPSLAEGFGLPAVEAMALGTPALASSFGAMAEVTQGAALLVDPVSGQALTEAITALDADGSLRRSLAAAGKVRAAEFSPSAFAARVGALYERLTAIPRG